MPLPRLLRPTRSRLLGPPTHLRLASHLPTLAAFALSCLRSATRRLMARCRASTVLPVVAWFTKATGKWATLPTTLIPHTRAVPCTSNVSKSKATIAILFLCEDRQQLEHTRSGLPYRPQSRIGRLMYFATAYCRDPTNRLPAIIS